MLWAQSGLVVEVALMPLAVELPEVVEALALQQRPGRLVGTLRSSRLLAGLDDSNNPVVGGRTPHLLA